ncbi:sigma-70 family RNA polymerase sigma factor [Haloechinothrix salitolerans]|uniref:RNA polymerase sigma factor n=1 Tax=Haloechinothrix salitolerans TaxID=926830 RepID=A0ABW2C3U0_9PSEU
MTGGPRDLLRLNCGHLFELHQWKARRFALRYVDPHEADDIVSESFARIFGVMQRGKGPTDDGFWSYLCTTIRNECASRARRRALEDRTVNDYMATVARNQGAYAADVVASYTTESALTNAFDRLPGRYRLVLILTVAEGQSCAEAGVTLNLGANAVAALAYRARKHLRALIDEEMGSLETSPEWAIRQERFAHQVASSIAA